MLVAKRPLLSAGGDELLSKCCHDVGRDSFFMLSTHILKHA